MSAGSVDCALQCSVCLLWNSDLSAPNWLRSSECQEFFFCPYKLRHPSFVGLEPLSWWLLVLVPHENRTGTDWNLSPLLSNGVYQQSSLKSTTTKTPFRSGRSYFEMSIHTLCRVEFHKQSVPWKRFSADLGTRLLLYLARLNVDRF